MGTILKISNPKLSFLQKIIAISFPENVHEWTASASVGATIFGNVIITGKFGSFATNVGHIYKVVDWPNPFLIPLSLPKDMSVVTFTQVPNSPPDGFLYWLPLTIDAIDGEVVTSANPSASISASFTIQFIGGGTIDAAATGVTSGRPGGDDEATDIVPTFNGNAGETHVVAGSASAGGSVAASVIVT